MSALEKEFLERMEKHKGVVFKISKMYMDRTDDQRDLFQEITYQVWKSYSTFQGKSEFSTWLYRIALNTAIVFLRTERKRSIIQRDEVHQLNLKEEEYNFQEEHDLKKMYEAIQQLNPIDKALIFYYLEDVPGREMAENLGITEVNARVKLNRAKEKLKKLVGN